MCPLAHIWSKNVTVFVSIFTVYSMKTPEESITEKPSAEK